MRKDKEQQKNKDGVQLKLFTTTGEPAGSNTDGIGKALDTGVELSSRLDQKRTLTQNILERDLNQENQQNQSF